MLKICRKGLHQYDGIRLRRCPECHRIARTSWAVANPEDPEQHKERLAAWFRANPEKVATKSARWKRANPGKVAAWNAAWFRANPERSRLHNARRLELIRTNPGRESVTTAHLRLLMEAQDGCCRYCRKQLAAGLIDLDHRIPLSRGGVHAPHNLCWSCAGCNRRKGDRPEVEFLLGLQTIAGEGMMKQTACGGAIVGDRTGWPKFPATEEE